MYLIIQCIVGRIEVYRNKEGENRGVILWHAVKSAMSTFIILLLHQNIVLFSLAYQGSIAMVET